MRVYQSYRAFIHKSLVPFKDLFFFVDNFLTEKSFCYKEILFHFDMDMQQNERYPVVEEFLKKHPYWRDFTQEVFYSFHGITNAPEKFSHFHQLQKGSNHISSHKPVDIEKLKYLLSKVPRPYNFPNVEVLFDGIDWLRSGGEGSISFSRSVWPSGANFVVIVKIEITDPNNPCQVLDDSVIARALNELFFGLLKLGDGRIIELSNEEEERVDLLKNKIGSAVTVFKDNSKIEQVKYDSFSEIAVASLDAAAVKFTVKKPLKAFLIGWDYKCVQIGVYYLRKIIKYGFRIEILISFKPRFSSAYLSREISISGLYFHFLLADDQILRSSQEVIDGFIADCKRIADEAELEFTESLFQLFGETPEWYFRGMSGGRVP